MADYASAQNAVAVTPHETNPQPAMRALYVGTGGTIVGRLKGSNADVTFLNVPSGAELAYAFSFIRVTGTTAAGMIALN